jgi:hypothetical protein
MGNHYHKPERFKHGERFSAGEEVVYNGELWVCLQDQTSSTKKQIKKRNL